MSIDMHFLGNSVEVTLALHTMLLRCKTATSGPIRKHMPEGSTCTYSTKNSSYVLIETCKIYW